MAILNMRTRTLLLALLFVLPTLSAAAAPVRIKDLVDVQGVRDNALFGYGLVVGLAGSGDSEIAPSDNLAVKIAGSGQVHLKTEPRHIETHIAGSGEIFHDR